jgi:MFS family permease
MTATIMVLMVGATGRIVARAGFKRPLVGGLLVLAGGIGALSLVRTDGSFLVDVLPATLIAATGMSLAYIPAMLAALSGARPEEGGLASGIVNTTYQVGSALGLAVMTAVATAQGADRLGDTGALVNGFQAAFIGAALIALGAAIATAIWLRSPRHDTAPAPATEGSFAD